MDSRAERRLRLIQAHLIPDADESLLRISANPTTGEFVSGQRYSVVLPEKLQTGKWNVYRSARSPLKLVDRIPEHPEIGTLHDNFVHAVENFQDYKYLGTRLRVDGTVGEYKWMTYGESGTARSAIGSGLRHYGLQSGARVGLYFINRPEWMIVDHACSAYSYISVPLYDTLGPDAVKYIVNHADIQAICCVPSTLNIVVGGVDEHLPSLPTTSGVELLSYTRLLSQGRSNMLPFCPPKPDDIATICYTSGTTGTPKGVVLSHGNLIASIAGMTLTVRFYSSDMITNAVKTSGVLKERLFNAAYNSKKQAVMSGMADQHVVVVFLSLASLGRKPSPMWDRLVFNKIKDKLGGRVRYLTSGASPLSPDVMEFLRVCFGCQVIEGYGMTETSCVISSMEEGDNLTGHVGSPNPACEIKLVDVPEMNYTSEDQPHPRGEICVRGPIVFQTYYKDEVQTREVIDDEGWLHTGDIGLWLPGGRLKIIDRKKNIFKLAQGEYIAPEKIENVYAKCKFVAQCFVYGDSLNSCLVAVVCVEPDVLKDWAASEGIKYEDLGQLCADPRARAAVLADMDAVGKGAQLRGFEFAKAVTLVLEPFTLENDLLTPTFKIKRPQAKAYFAQAISHMYAELSTSDPTPQKML
ncbi:long chain acyl-coa synthetase 7 peroxisomal [Phtheirospermum japonicum]|uniref:Long chain acyl-coa synthetase 7 peroxisomal n=1 Tax=Phtheirospermum japonicum TaxID=374723 RepID=A0A830CRH6_9LAMI|nr:long chain acyl-coa synthetase 7 peroxisomal [Phtheirospermum japonicum]